MLLKPTPDNSPRQFLFIVKKDISLEINKLSIVFKIKLDLTLVRFPVNNKPEISIFSQNGTIILISAYTKHISKAAKKRES